MWLPDFLKARSIYERKIGREASITWLADYLATRSAFESPPFERRGSIVWKIEDFQALFERLNGSNMPHPYVDSPTFGVELNGPQYFLRLYTKGDHNIVKDHFSLHLKMKCVGKYPWAIGKKDDIPKVNRLFDFNFIKKNGEKDMMMCTYT